MTEKKQIGRILLQQRALSPEQLDRALAEQRGGRLASRLAADGTISDVSALKALSEQHGIPGIDLDQICLRLEDLELLPREIAEKHLILPVLMRDDRLFIAMANPREKKVIDELEFVTGKKVYPYVALEGVLERVIESAYTRKARGEAYYVGPRCPPDVLQKLGLDPSRPSSQPPQAVGVRGRGAGQRAAARGAGRRGGRRGRTRFASDEVEDADFGDMSRELSVVTELPEEAAVAAAQPLPGARTVLVVDDEADIRKMLKRLLVDARLSRGRSRPRAPGAPPGQGARARPDRARRHAPRGARLRDRAAHQGQQALRPHPDHHGQRRLPRLALRRGPEANLRRRPLHRKAVQDRRCNARGGKRPGHRSDAGRSRA